MNQDIRPIATDGIHDQLLSFLLGIIGHRNYPEVKILDAGAGHGYLTQKLFEKGFTSVSACELFPELFRFDAVTCDKANLGETLPYADGTFDCVVAVEVVEHLVDHCVFFSECQRILKKGGKLVITTPNVLSLKSRFRYLVHGFPYSFKPLDPARDDGMQHVASLTFDQLRYIGATHGLKVHRLSYDKYQTSSVLYLWFYPFIALFNFIFTKRFKIHNTLKLLLGRKLFMAFEKE